MHDSIDDNDSQVAQEQETYSSARLAVLRQSIVYDKLNICSLYSSNKLSKLSVAQLRLTCSYYNMDIEKSALHYFYLGSCKVLFLHKGMLAMLSECKISSDNNTNNILFHLLYFIFLKN